ncbi:MAG: hypothetical protein E7614_01875 [Ruminococcaceae bacterium]|nr:hypothetical protein [Oscillospiraceae bacterium]
MKRIFTLLLGFCMLLGVCVFASAAETQTKLDVEICFSKEEIVPDDIFDVTLKVTNKQDSQIHCGSFSFIYDTKAVEYVEQKPIENWELTNVHYKDDGEILLLAEVNAKESDKFEDIPGVKNGETISFTFTFKALKAGASNFKAEYIDFALFDSKKIEGVFIESLEKSAKIAGYTAEIKGVSLQVGAGIELCFTGFVPEEYEGAKIHFSQAHIDNDSIDNVDMDVEGESKGENLYDYLMPVHPARLGDKVEAYLVYNGEQISEVVSYSVLDYCNYVFDKGKSAISGNATDEQYKAIVTLLSDLLAYGDEAQKYTDYNTNNLVSSAVNKDDALEPSQFQAITSTDYEVIKGTVSKPAFSFVTMTFDNNFWLSYGIHADSVEGMKMKVLIDTKDGKYFFNLDHNALIKAEGEENLYYLHIKPWATGIDYVYTITLFDADGKEGTTLRYSAKSYVESTQGKDGYSDFSKTLYNYGKSIENYVYAMEGK